MTQPVDPSLDRRAAVQEHRDRLLATLDDLTREVAQARDGARVDGGHRPENRGERGAVSAQGALAGALAARRAEVEAHLQRLDLIAEGPRHVAGPGAFVTAEEASGELVRVVILPGAAGETLHTAPGFIGVSPESPLGRALHAAAPGDVVVVRRRDVEVEVEVVDVR